MKQSLLLLFAFSFTLAAAQPCIPNSNSVAFDGTGSYIDFGSATAIDTLSGPVTIEAWIFASAWGFNSAQNSIFCTHGWTNGEQGMVLRAGGTGILSFNIAGIDTQLIPVSWQEVESPINSIPLNTWTHVAGTFSGTDLKVFVNANEVASIPFFGRIVPSSYGAKIGKLADQNQSPGRYFSGNIDEVRVWNRALSASELSTSMGTHLDPTGAIGLVGYWRLNEGSGVSISDLGNGSGNGTAINSSWSLNVPFNEVPPMPVITWNGSALISSASFNNEWNLNGTPIIGANGTSHVPTQNGTYTVTTTGLNGCSATSLPYLLTSVGLGELSSDRAIMIWPNPAQDLIYVKVNTRLEGEAELSIYDIRNKLVRQTYRSEAGNQGVSINISDLPRGVYRLSIVCGSDKLNTRFLAD
ncbi:MAG TPA: T9SS type A sorting domain-containing protein [Bacteroidia bacterium]|nr:T9SS type A sorting domain-containing protein [Bacteroidia bacterium]